MPKPVGGTPRPSLPPLNLARDSAGSLAAQQRLKETDVRIALTPRDAMRAGLAPAAVDRIYQAVELYVRTTHTKPNPKTLNAPKMKADPPLPPHWFAHVSHKPAGF